MNNINYMRVLTNEEQVEMRKNIIKWVEEILESDFSTYLYNILLQIKHMIEYVEREKIK
jgi:hypothetical protein